ncbi:DUF4421 domain-containing protein [Chitinophaga sp. HK235]|uniref:DUF4421 domain-containing protein n=1 Tax=Chitinophaga sp. HK235 TaxID=2952571 RepID=UPI001BA89461|nr:DUF4421 domain-containing protein [Chitinophaga sp. HK235]
MTKRTLLILLIICGCIAGAKAQGKFLKWLHTDNDTAYIEEHTEDLTFRLYGSRKYTRYDIMDKKLKKDILYRPNTPSNIGVGVNYRFIGINLGFNFPFVNRRNDKYGNTRFIDLQSHIYLRKLVVDFYGQKYKGFYISNPEKIFEKEYSLQNPYPQRPDIKNLGLGMNVQYIFNDKRFSYRAPNLQNEYQKKSAGSFIVGGEFYLAKIQGDSSLIPTNFTDTTFLRNEHYYKTLVATLAANIGYAHTFVFKKHFFLSLSVTTGLGAAKTSLHYDSGDVSHSVGLLFSNTVRASLGYNSSRYFAGVHYVGMTARSRLPVPDTYQAFGNGNLRVSLVRRFSLKKPLWRNNALSKTAG